MFSDALPSLQGAKRILPHKQDGLGHFMALLQKRGGGEELLDSNPNAFDSQNDRAESKKLDKALDEALDLFLDFSDDLKIDFESVLGIEESIKKSKRRFKLYADKLYYTTSIKIPEKSFRILRNGLLLGEIKKNKFIPSQSFANCILPHQIEKKLHFKADDIHIKKYLKGETLVLQEEKGYILLYVDNLPLAWGLSDGKK